MIRNKHSRKAIRIPLVLSLIALLLLGGCSSPSRTIYAETDMIVDPNDVDESANWERMCGKWYGIKLLREGGKREWLLIREANGKYTSIFLNSLPGKAPERSVEVGEWGISGDVYFTVFKGWMFGARLSPAKQGHDTREAYHIVKLANDECIYECAESGELYRVVRVSDDFEL